MCAKFHQNQVTRKPLVDLTRNDPGTFWGQPTIYFAIGDHVNVSWCRSHTNASGVMAT